jgi:hypothetical protein
MAVAAFTAKGDENEFVDITHLCRSGSFYGLHLPAGYYQLLALADLSGDGRYESSEIVGLRSLRFDDETYPDHVAGDINIDLAQTAVSYPGLDLSILVRPIRQTRFQPSLFYPKGTIRSLDDPLFSPSVATLGMYDPAAFLEIAPMMFYALEEEVGHKVPVVFVHGIDGSITDFLPLLDCDSNENKLRLFVSIATPFGGHPSAKIGVERAPLVLPSWYDLNPEGELIHNLYEKPLPECLEHHLIYAYRDSLRGKPREDSDGVVPVSSQLHPPALEQSTHVYGYTQGHFAILSDDQVIDQVLELIERVKAPYPKAHMEFFVKGGFDTPLPSRYTAKEQYVIRTLGRYLQALSRGWLKPINKYEEHFVSAMEGRARATTFFETGWLKFESDFPHLAISGGN